MKYLGLILIFTGCSWMPGTDKEEKEEKEEKKESVVEWRLKQLEKEVFVEIAPKYCLERGACVRTSRIDQIIGRLDQANGFAMTNHNRLDYIFGHQSKCYNYWYGNDARCIPEESELVEEFIEAINPPSLEPEELRYTVTDEQIELPTERRECLGWYYPPINAVPVATPEPEYIKIGKWYAKGCNDGYVILGDEKEILLEIFGNGKIFLRGKEIGHDDALFRALSPECYK